MSIRPMLDEQSEHLDGEIRQHIIEIRQKMPDLGYQMERIYTEARGGMRFSGLYKVLQPDATQSQGIGYLRVSSDLQSDNHSLVTQATRILNLAQRRDVLIARFYIDAGITGADSRRPAFLGAMRAAVNGHYDALYTYDLYRFYRGMQGLTKHYHVLLENDVDLCSVAMGDTDLSSRDGKLLLYMRGIMGEMYLDDLSRTVKDNKLTRVRDGYSNASIAPFGYCRGTCLDCTDNQGAGYCPRFDSQQDLWRELGDDPKVFVPHPIDQHAFRTANRLHVTGDFSDADIARRLSRPYPADMERMDLSRRTVIEPLKQGRAIVQMEDDTFAIQHPSGALQFFRPQGRPGCQDPDRRFSKDAVRDMLQNPFYAGFIVYRQVKKQKKWRQQQHKRFKLSLSEMNRRQRDDAPLTGDHGMLFPGLHIPLIEVAQFERSQQVRGMRNYSPSNASRQRRVYPLSGVLRCQRCGETFRGSSGNGDVRYYEDSGVAKGVANCPRRMFRAEPIEHAIFARVEQLQIPETWDADILHLLQKGPAWNALRREKRAAQSRLNAVREMLQQELISIREFKAAKRQCESHIARLERQAHTDDDHHRALLRDFPRLWEAATAKERRGLLRAIFSVIWLRDGDVVGYETWTPFEALLPSDESDVVVDG